MRIPGWIVSAAACLYAVLLFLAWLCGGRWEDRASEKLLRSARDEFVSRIEGQIATMQWYQTGLIFDALGRATNAAPVSVSEMRAIAGRLYADEFNIVSSNGIVIASNLPKVVGDDWHNDPHTAEFLQLLSPTSQVGRMAQPRMSQPFRHGSVNPEYYCTYFAVAFDDRSGIVEVGFSIDRLVAVLAYADSGAFSRWRFGRNGHFSAIDADGDHAPDRLPPGSDEARLERGVLDRTDDAGVRSYRLTFAFAGRLFAALVPNCEFGEERRVAFLVFALTSALLILIFSAILVRLVHARRRVEALRQAADARQAADLAVARTIQLSSLPNLERFRKAVFSASLSAVTHPAREVGGDFYDSHFTDATHLAFVVADVAGKGFSAAMFMMRAKNEIFNALCAEHELDKAVASANARICAHNGAEMLVTAWVGVLDIHSGELEYVNAGHNPPFLRRADGTVGKVAGRGGLLLGVKADAAYRVHRLTLASGDLLFAYTDGITEAMNRDRAVYGEARLREALKGCGTDPRDAISAVTGSVGGFVAGAEQSDDITAFALVWHGMPENRQLTLPAHSDSLASAKNWLNREIRLASGKSRMRLLNAADEIASNIVRHSGAAEFSLTVENAPGRTRLAFTDAGREYNPLSHVDPDTHASLEERPEGGLGILMAKRLVDAVSYRRCDGRNVLTLVKLDA